MITSPCSKYIISGYQPRRAVNRRAGNTLWRMQTLGYPVKYSPEYVITCYIMLIVMEGRKGHNSVLLFYFIYIFVFISFVTFIILILSLSFYHSNINSTINYNFTIPIFQFHDSYFTNFNFIILTFTILISSLWFHRSNFVILISNFYHSNVINSIFSFLISSF